MDLPHELRDFLVSRRARLAPEVAGVQPYAGRRRVPGLRREEVAYLAGVSADYYTKFERGKVSTASAEVIDAIARALQLDDVEHEHLRNLVHAQRPRIAKPASARAARRVPAGMQSVLDAVTVPAFIQNERLDIVAGNLLGKALYPFVGEDDSDLFNSSRFVFLDPRSHEFYRDRELVLRNNVALLRAAAGRNPDDDDLVTLIGQLSTKSVEFREMWASHNVLNYRAGRKRYHHPLVGDVEFGYETLVMPAYPGLTMLVYNVEPNSPTAAAMRLLASWSAAPPDPAAQRQHSDAE